jgi:antitoxin component of RelBE/YafQ-DinJ toxin-antitoxin module
MKKKTGRPPTPEGQLKNHYLQVRIDESESHAYHAAAALAGLPLSGWVRLRLRETAAKELKKAGKEVAFHRR